MDNQVGSKLTKSEQEELILEMAKEYLESKGFGVERTPTMERVKLKSGIIIEKVANLQAYDFTIHQDGSSDTVKVLIATRGRSYKKDSWRVTCWTAHLNPPGLFIIWMPDLGKFIEYEGTFFAGIKRENPTRNIPMADIKRYKSMQRM